ncbi:MAG: hypothetical protein PVH31_09845 [Ectothiorhodospiraceae bacterium]|jgi:hypothetical protein
MSQFDQSAVRPEHYFDRSFDSRHDRAMEYCLTAPHGWERLLDNHLEIEEDRRRAVNHMAVLGEN